MLIYEVLKIRDFSKLLRLQPFLRDLPFGNHWSNARFSFWNVV